MRNSNFQYEILELLGEYEQSIYKGFKKKIKTCYFSYINSNRKIKNFKIMSPSEWVVHKAHFDANTTFDKIAKELGFTSASHAYRCYKTAMRYILQLIYKNPKRYSAIIEYGGLVI